jgi:hypothetical protein
MKRLIVAAALVAPLGASDPAAAGEAAFLSGEQLQELCKGVDASCTAYLMGVLDALNLMESRSGGGSAFCAPEITSDEVTDVVRKHLERHPARWESPAATLVTEAMVEAFPCDAKGE